MNCNKSRKNLKLKYWGIPQHTIDYYELAEAKKFVIPKSYYCFKCKSTLLNQFGEET